jgi:hypothetical protein
MGLIIYKKNYYTSLQKSFQALQAWKAKFPNPSGFAQFSGPLGSG